MRHEKCQKSKEKKNVIFQETKKDMKKNGNSRFACIQGIGIYSFI